MLRIIGGAWRGRRLHTPPGRGTRPTADRVRENLFNVLGNLMEMEGATVVDLFAGTGALGIEALSRGAALAVLVEAQGRNVTVIRTNLDTVLPGWNPAARQSGEQDEEGHTPQAPPDAAQPRAQVVRQKAEAWLRAPGLPGPVRLVMLDPPYGYPGLERLLASLATHPLCAEGTIIVVESEAGRVLEAPAGLESLPTRRYGDTQLCFFRHLG